MNNTFEKLVKAVKKSDTEKVAQIIQDQTININEFDQKSGKNVFQIAMQNNDNDIFNMLMKFPHYNPQILNKKGESLLELAIMLNEVDYVSKILNKGVSKKKKNAQGETALQFAIKNKINPEIIKKLINYGFDINDKILQHGSLLHLAIVSNQPENFICLLEQENISIREIDDDENTCLILAVKMNKGEIIMAILQKLNQNIMTQIEKQFFINSQDFEGNTALHIACIKDFQTITGILQKEGKVLGFDPSIKNKQGKTCQMILEEREKDKKIETQNQHRRKEEKVVRRKEREEEKIRVKKEEQMRKRQEKKRKKEEEEMLQEAIQKQKETQKNKLLWGAGIGFVAILGLMYLLILNSIQEKSTNSF